METCPHCHANGMRNVVSLSHTSTIEPARHSNPVAGKQCIYCGKWIEPYPVTMPKSVVGSVMACLHGHYAAIDDLRRDKLSWKTIIAQLSIPFDPSSVSITWKKLVTIVTGSAPKKIKGYDPRKGQTKPVNTKLKNIQIAKRNVDRPYGRLPE